MHHSTRIKGKTYVTARLIAEAYLGRPLKGEEEVHHVDENPLNNATRNLVICPSRAYHMLLHVRSLALDACGNANHRKCNICKEYDATDNMSTAKNGNGQSRYWHRKCAAEYQYQLYIARKEKENTTKLPVIDVDALLEELEDAPQLP